MSRWRTVLKEAFLQNRFTLYLTVAWVVGATMITRAFWPVFPYPFATFEGMGWRTLSAFLLVMGQCVRQTHKTHQQGMQWGVGLIALYLLLVSPSVFQWYLVWLLALVPLTQSWLTPAWLYWSWSVNLDYLEALPTFAGALYWLQIVEYVPVFLWIGGYWWFRHAGTQVLTRSDTINAAS